jgi:hypothetical protein
MQPETIADHARLVLAAVRRRPLLAAGVSIWCAAILAATIAAPNVPGGIARALGLAGATPGTSALAGAHASGGAADRARRAGAPGAVAAGRPAGAGAAGARGGATQATPDRSSVLGVTVDDAASSLLTVDGGADGVAARLVVSGAQPGSVAIMLLRVRNDGDGNAHLQLTRGAIDDLPGRGGGRLSGRLALAIADLATGDEAWRGLLGDFDAAALGSLAAGESRRWRLELRFPDGGLDGSDNAYQGAGVSATYVVGEL